MSPCWSDADSPPGETGNRREHGNVPCPASCELLGCCLALDEPEGYAHDRAVVLCKQGDPKRRPRLTRRVQSVHGYEVSAMATDGAAESEAAKEIGILRSLCHPNIVRLMEVIGADCCHLYCCGVAI